MSNEMNDMDFLLQMADELGGGGGGFLTTGLVKVDHGIKVFLKLPQSETFFPFTLGDQASTSAALRAANEKILESGEANQYPRFAIRFEIMKETVLETKQDGTQASANWKENLTKDVVTISWDKVARRNIGHPV